MKVSERGRKRRRRRRKKRRSRKSRRTRKRVMQYSWQSIANVLSSREVSELLNEQSKNRKQEEQEGRNSIWEELLQVCNMAHGARWEMLRS